MGYTYPAYRYTSLCVNKVWPSCEASLQMNCKCFNLRLFVFYFMNILVWNTHSISWCLLIFNQGNSVDMYLQIFCVANTLAGTVLHVKGTARIVFEPGRWRWSSPLIPNKWMFFSSSGKLARLTFSNFQIALTHFRSKRAKTNSFFALFPKQSNVILGHQCWKGELVYIHWPLPLITIDSNSL
jgi:hypothetical protein